MTVAPFKCKFCGSPSYVDPSDQTPPADICHDSDHSAKFDFYRAPEGNPYARVEFPKARGIEPVVVLPGRCVCLFGFEGKIYAVCLLHRKRWQLWRRKRFFRTVEIIP